MIYLRVKHARGTHTDDSWKPKTSVVPQLQKFPATTTWDETNGDGVTVQMYSVDYSWRAYYKSLHGMSGLAFST